VAWFIQAIHAIQKFDKVGKKGEKNVNKRKGYIVVAGILCYLAIVSTASAQSSADYDLTWNVIGGGGGPVDSASYTMRSTVGQTAIGYSTNSYELGAGYWYGATLTVPENSDLEITGTWVCWPDNCTICYNVTNTGTGTAPAGHNTMLFVDGLELVYDPVTVVLAAGDSHIGCFNYVWTYTQPADTITVCADFNNTVSESNEANNCLCETWMCGDVNMDGTVTPADSGKVFNRYLDSNYPLDLPWAADVNGDGTITPADSGKIFNRYLDSSYDLDCCCE
jgi:hypothetical protein